MAAQEEERRKADEERRLKAERDRRMAEERRARREVEEREGKERRQRAEAEARKAEAEARKVEMEARKAEADVRGRKFTGMQQHGTHTRFTRPLHELPVRRTCSKHVWLRFAGLLGGDKVGRVGDLPFSFSQFSTSLVLCSSLSSVSSSCALSVSDRVKNYLRRG